MLQWVWHIERCDEKSLTKTVLNGKQGEKRCLVDLGRNGWTMWKKILKNFKLNVGEGVLNIGKIGLLLFGRFWFLGRP